MVWRHFRECQWLHKEYYLKTRQGCDEAVQRLEGSGAIRAACGTIIHQLSASYGNHLAGDKNVESTLIFCNYGSITSPPSLFMATLRATGRVRLPDKLAHLELISRVVDLPLSATYFGLMIIADEKHFSNQAIYPMVHAGIILAVVLDIESILNTPGWIHLPQLSHGFIGFFDFCAFLLITIGYFISWLGSNWNNGEDPNRKLPRTWADETSTYVLTPILIVIHIVMFVFHWHVGCRNRRRRQEVKKEQRVLHLLSQPTKAADDAVL